MRSVDRLTVLALFAGAALPVAAMLPAAAAPGDPSVQVFAPGVISGPANDGSPAFTPDGKTLFFTRSGADAGMILESQQSGDGWSTPTIAPFSGEWNDQHPTMSPDGSFLVFVSTRPAPGSSGRVAHLWRVDRRGDGWSEPVHLPATVNVGPSIFAPSIGADGSIYFLKVGKPRTLVIYRSRFVRGSYETAAPMPFSTAATADVDPEIAPDQSFMVFASSGRKQGDSKEHLYVAFSDGGRWQRIVPLRFEHDDANGGSNDNEPSIGPGDRTLYFDSDRTLPLSFPRTPQQAQADNERIDAWDNGNTNVWFMDFAPWLAQARAGGG